MEQQELLYAIDELNREIEILPEGSITRKNIKGKDYYYHRVYENGKRVEKYVVREDVPELQYQIGKRKELEKQNVCFG